MKSLQKTIFDHNVYLPDKRIVALNTYWAGPFREKVLSLIDEEPFRPFCHPDNGGPNVPVITLIAASLYERLPKVYRKVYRERNGYFADVWVDGAHASGQNARSTTSNSPLPSPWARSRI